MGVSDSLRKIVLHCLVEFYSMGVVVFANISEMRAYSRQKRRDGKTIGLVPTLVCNMDEIGLIFITCRCYNNWIH